jgi:Ricin-type beta-trefoil lectin domain
MFRRRRLTAAAIVTAVTTILALAGSAAQAAPAAPVASGYTLPAGIIDPCPAAAPGTAGCAALTTAPGADNRDSGKVPQSAAASITPAGYSPANLQQAYQFQGATSGSGQTVAVVTVYNEPDAAGDMAAYRSQYGLAACTVADKCFTQVGQTGSTTSLPGTGAGFNVAVSESLDMISAICPNCHILLVEASSPLIADLGTAENEAVTLGAKFIDNAWDTTESPSETGWDTSYFDHPGVVITAPAGDDGPVTSYPAASQYVTAVGGTTLTADSSAPRGYTETAWSGSGAGCSTWDPKPSWQTDTGCANRSMNDLAADADPSTPVAYYDTLTEGGWGEGSGTAVAAAIIAAAYALAGTPGPGSYPASYPYEHPGGAYTTPGNAYTSVDGLNNITTGPEGICVITYLCTAGPGYNGPTGLGTPATPLALTASGGQAGVVYSGMTGMCLDDQHGATTTGTHVQLYTCNGTTSQDWTLEPDGTVRFDSGYCVADSGTVTTDGYHLVDLQPCDPGNPAMQWVPRADDSLYNPATGWCLADPGASPLDSTQLVNGTCNGTASQQWTVPYTRPVISGPIGSQITAASLCMSDAGTSTANGNKIMIWDCNGDVAQSNWTVAANGTIQFMGKCIATLNNGTANGTLIVLWSCEGNPNSVWTGRSDGSFVNTKSGTCLTDPSNNLTNGTQLVLYTCNGSAAESWNPH